MKKTLLILVVAVLLPLRAICAQVVYVSIEPVVSPTTHEKFFQDFTNVTAKQWEAVLQEWLKNNPTVKPILGMPYIRYDDRQDRSVLEGFFIFFETPPPLDPNKPAISGARKVADKGT